MFVNIDGEENTKLQWSKMLNYKFDGFFKKCNLQYSY